MLKGMPPLVPPWVPPGRMAALGQPVIDLPGDLVLRPFDGGDVDAVLAAYTDPDIQRWHHLHLTSRDEAWAWIDQWGRAWQTEREGSWAVASRSTGTVAGRLGLRHVDLAEGWAELTFWVRPAYRQRGVAAAAVGAGADWLFGSLGLHRLEISHSVANDRSCRAAERAGFRAEGVRRGAQRHADGWHDVHLHARLASDGPVR